MTRRSAFALAVVLAAAGLWPATGVARPSRPTGAIADLVRPIRTPAAPSLRLQLAPDADPLVSDRGSAFHPLTVGLPGSTGAAEPLASRWGALGYAYRVRPGNEDGSDGQRIGRRVLDGGDRGLFGGQGWGWGLDTGLRLSFAAAGAGSLDETAGTCTPGDLGCYRFEYGEGDQLRRLVAEHTGQTTTLDLGILGRITARDGVAFAYDHSGRRIEDDRFTYTWDWRGRLVQVDVRPASGVRGSASELLEGHRILYAYDALGRLTRRTHLGARPDGGSDDARPFIDARELQWEGQTLLTDTGLSFSLQPIWRTTHIPGPGGLDDAVQLRVETLDPASGSVTSTRLLTVVRDDLGSVISLVDETSTEPVVEARVLYTPYGEAHLERAPELRRASFDPTLTSLETGSTPIQQTIANPAIAQPGAVRLAWTLPLDQASLATGAVLERRGASGWAPIPESQRWIGPHPDQPEQLVVLPMTGWDLDTTYRIRLTTALRDRFNRSLPEGHLIELAIPPPGTPGAPILDRTYPATFDSAATAATTLGGTFPGGQTSLFQGLWTDPVTGIACARARWYDARNASWLSEDPLGAVDSPNLYAAFGLDPQNNTDPLGLATDWNSDPAAQQFLEGQRAGRRSQAAESARLRAEAERRRQLVVQGLRDAYKVRTGQTAGPHAVGCTTRKW